MIQTQCTGCFREYKLDDKYVGKTIRCKDCGTTFKVEAAADEPLDVEFDEPQTPAAAPRSAAGRTSSKKSSSKSSASGSKLWLWIVGGVLGVGLVCCGGVGLVVMKVKQQVAALSVPDIPLGDPNDLFPLADVPLPQFPPLGQANLAGRSDAQVYSVDFGSIPANGDQPGMKMKLRVYLPPGRHANQSLPCVLIAPAGTNLLSGNALGKDDHEEALPYAEAGMAAVYYSLDGAMDPAAQANNNPRDAYLSFRRARAGVVNGRNALEYVLAQVPQVDPKRIYSAGHSSAGTLSLLLAEHEPRLHGALAYAPVTDLKSAFGGADDNAVMGMVLPGIGDFAKQSSPSTHVSRISCPVFLFHARDDMIEPFARTEAFDQLLESNGKTHTFSVAETGDHFQSMIAEGIPRGIEWIKAQSPASSPPEGQPTAPTGQP